MKVIALNGSPRKNWNTHMLLEKALEGAASSGAHTEMVNLYDISFKGCTSCFACKRKGGSLDVCAMQDELRAVLLKIRDCGAMLIGSPIYFGSVTGETRSLIERLCFPYISYDKQPASFGKKIRTGLIYTMNAPESMLDKIGYTQRFEGDRALMERIFGESEILISAETYQFDDYSKYAASAIGGEQRKQRRETVFPLELEKAFALGKRLASE